MQGTRYFVSFLDSWTFTSLQNLPLTNGIRVQVRTYVDVRKCRSVCIATFLCYFSSYLFIPFSLRTLLKFSVKLHCSRRCAAFRCIFKTTIAQKPIWVLSICHNYEKLAPFPSFWYLFTGQGLLRSMGGNIVEFTQPTKELSYNQPNADQNGIQKWCNDHGLIAFRHKSELDKLITMLKWVFKSRDLSFGLHQTSGLLRKRRTHVSVKCLIWNR